MKHLTLLLLLFTVDLCAQTAQITGRVADSSNAIMTNAKVSIENTETGVRRQVLSNDEGYYSAPLLARGHALGSMLDAELYGKQDKKRAG